MQIYRRRRRWRWILFNSRVSFSAKLAPKGNSSLSWRRRIFAAPPRGAAVRRSAFTAEDIFQ
jgi:hypothetical protein